MLNDLQSARMETALIKTVTLICDKVTSVTEKKLIFLLPTENMSYVLTGQANASKHPLSTIYKTGKLNTTLQLQVMVTVKGTIFK